jgi:hypothetical protein
LFDDTIAENARLKAEVERLDTLCKQLSRQHSDISCENIMLRKAGYAMAVKINVHGINDRFTDSQKLVDDWSYAAKEGKQSHG